MKEREAVVQDNREVATDTFLMTLACDFPPFTPGQFLMLRINSTCDPFLRRPLAILSLKGDSLEILYKVKGSGTSLLAGKRPGDVMSALGPLGNGFSTPGQDEEAIYIAGGTGLPPILALAEKVRRGRLIIGAFGENDIPLWNRISSIRDVHAQATTEDGSFGKKGLATEALKDLLHEISRPSIIYACGPEGMLREITEQARMFGARCEVSLEEYMACGFGVCSACVVKTSEDSRKVCAQGPVFDAFSIKWRD